MDWPVILRLYSGSKEITHSVETVLQMLNFGLFPGLVVKGTILSYP